MANIDTLLESNYRNGMKNADFHIEDGFIVKIFYITTANLNG